MIDFLKSLGTGVLAVVVLAWLVFGVVTFAFWIVSVPEGDFSFWPTWLWLIGWSPFMSVGIFILTLWGEIIRDKW